MIRSGLARSGLSHLLPLAAGLPALLLLPARIVPARIVPVPAAATTTSTTTTTTTSPGGLPKLVKGGTVVVAVPSLPVQFNPNAPSGAGQATAMVGAQLWPSPFVIGPGGSEQPSIGFDSAELVSVSPQVVVYTINKSAVWSDGVPITVADFREAWHAQLAYGAGLPATDPYEGYQDIASITGSAGGKVVTVTFLRPYAQWADLFSGLVPAHVAERYGWVAGFAGSHPAHLVSGGPYEVGSVIPGRRLVLVRNPRWWGTPPALDRIVFEVVRSPGAILAGLEDGTIQVAQVAPSRALDESIWADPTLREQVSLSPMLWQLDFNLNDPVISSLLVREAVAKAVNRAELAGDTVDFSAPAVPLSGNRLYLVGAPDSQGNSGAYSAVDDSEAVGLLAAAGYHLDQDGIARDQAGAPLRLHLVGPTDSGLAIQIEALLQAQLLDVGILLSVTNVARSQLLSTVLPRGGYQLALAPYLLSPYPSENARYYEHPVSPVASVPVEASPSALSGAATGATATGVTPTGPTTTTAAAGTTTTTPAEVTFPRLAPGNGSEPEQGRTGSVTADVLGYSDPLVGQLLSQASSQLNELSMDALYNEADTKLWLDLPTLPLFQQPVELVSTRALINLHQTATLAGPMTDAQNWALRVLPPPTTTTAAPAAAG